MALWWGGLGESPLAVPGSLRFHSAAPGAVECDQRVQREAKGGNLTQVSHWLFGNTQDCLSESHLFMEKYLNLDLHRYFDDFFFYENVLNILVCQIK